MITILLIISTILLALSGLTIMHLCKTLREAAALNKDRLKKSKRKSYENLQMFLDEVAAHDIALEEVDELKESLAQVKPHTYVVEAYEREAEALKEEAEGLREEAEGLRDTQRKLKLKTDRANIRCRHLVVAERKARIEMNIALYQLKFLEVSDGSYTVRAYKSENYSKLYVVGHGYLREAAYGWPYKTSAKPVGQEFDGKLIRELKYQIAGVRSARYVGVK